MCRVGSSLEVYSGVLDRVLKHASGAGINNEIPVFANDLVKRGVNADLAEEEVVSLIKILRTKARN